MYDTIFFFLIIFKVTMWVKNVILLFVVAENNRYSCCTMQRYSSEIQKCLLNTRDFVGQLYTILLHRDTVNVQCTHKAINYKIAVPIHNNNKSNHIYYISSGYNMYYTRSFVSWNKCIYTDNIFEMRPNNVIIKYTTIGPQRFRWC